MGDITALRYWFGDQATMRVARPLSFVSEYESTEISKAAIPWGLLGRLGIGGDIHMDVPRQSCRGRLVGASVHVYSRPAPFTFVKLADGVFIESPVACLVRMAPKMSRGERIFLLNRLTGDYQVNGQDVIRRHPLATLEELEAYVRRAAGCRGVVAIRPLLRYVVGSTASPAEARIAALLALPTRWGGYGLPLPQANARIDVASGGGRDVARYADLFWPQWGLVLEYDSDSFHVGAEKIGEDSDRRAVLQKEGLTVVTLTNLQLKSRKKLDDVVWALCVAMGRRFQVKDAAQFAKRNALLRNELWRVSLLR